MSTIGNWRGPNIIKDGLILYLEPSSPNSYYYKTETIIKDISGNAFNGSGGNAYDATLIGGPTFDKANCDSILFSGNGDYINLLNDGYNTPFSTQTFTIDFWYKTDFTGQPYDVLWSYDYISHTPPYYSQHLRIDSIGNRETILFGYNANGVYTFLDAPLFSITTDTWYNVVISYSPTKQTLYKNGLTVAQSNTTNPIIYYNQQINIGKSNFASGIIKGNIGSVKFYNKSLSDSEVLQNYDATKSRFGL